MSNSAWMIYDATCSSPSEIDFGWKWVNFNPQGFGRGRLALDLSAWEAKTKESAK
jgi:hypothetical protein